MCFLLGVFLAAVEHFSTRHAEQCTQERSGAVFQLVDVRCRALTSSLFVLPLQDSAEAALRDSSAAGVSAVMFRARYCVIQVGSGLPSRVCFVLAGVV
jgi:hypothetical protein